MYRYRGGRAATRFKRRPKDCVIAESDRYLLIVQLSVGEEFDAFVVGIARLTLEVIAYIHNLFTSANNLDAARDNLLTAVAALT
ncbi:MAG TPA: hypothetical protein VF534_14910 [Paraburkholderia sp.]